MNANNSFVIVTWNLPATMLENSLWTLAHQSLPPREIVVAETSPGGAQHEETRAVCSKYPLVRLVEAYWSRFNGSRGLNVAIRNTNPDAALVAAVGAEILFSKNFVEALNKRVNFKDSFICGACGKLSEKDSVGVTPESAWSRWDDMLSKLEPPTFSPGAMMCASREWWFDVRGFDEARRPYSYLDADIFTRAQMSGLVTHEHDILWGEAQEIHLYHPPNGLFYTVSGYVLDDQDVDFRRNGPDWGRVEGDEPVRIPGT